MMLQKWQRNEIFEAIKAAGLNPREFRLEDGEAVERIMHLRSASHFLLSDAAHYVGSYVVGDAPSWPYEAYNWPGLMKHISRWLVGVKRDVDMPDLWAELRREANLLGVGPDEAIENTPFTPDEQDFMAERLHYLRDDVKRTYSLSDTQLRDLDAKLDYLIEATDRLGRIDWRHVFVGAMFGYLLEVAVPPDMAHDILLTLLRSTGHFFVQAIQVLPNG